MHSRSDDEDEQNLVESMLLKVLNSKKAADARRHQQAIQVRDSCNFTTPLADNVRTVHSMLTALL